MTYTSLNELLRSRIELMIDTQRNYGWGARQAGQLKLTTIQTSGIELASDGESTTVGRGATAKLSLQLTVDEEMANTNGVAHGGYLATLADLGSSLPLAAIWQDGGSGIGMADDHAGLAALQTYYLLPAQLGELIEIAAWTVHVGRVTATLQFEIRSKETGRLLAYGTHVKHDAVTPPSQARSKL